LPAPSGDRELAPPDKEKVSSNLKENTDLISETEELSSPEDLIIQEKDKRIAELEEQQKRMQADFENYKKRKDEEWEEYRKYASEKLILEMVCIQDNLERALKAAQETNNLRSLIDGLQLVLRQIKCLLVNEGVNEIPALGCKFDPCLHQAVQREESKNVPDETVVEEYQRGYKIGDKILRPSLVKVSRHPDELNKQNIKEE